VAPFVLVVMDISRRPLPQILPSRKSETAPRLLPAPPVAFLVVA